MNTLLGIRKSSVCAASFLALGLAIGTVVAATAEEASPKALLSGYEAVANALYRDSLPDAIAAASALAANPGGSALAAAAKAVAGAKTLKEARESFKQLSQGAIGLSKANPGYVVMHCSMVPGGGGDWVQVAGTEVCNPYFGSEMPHCGGPKK